MRERKGGMCHRLICLFKHVANGSLTVMKPVSNPPFSGGYPMTGTIFTGHFRRWLVESNWSEKGEQEQQDKSKGCYDLMGLTSLLDCSSCSTPFIYSSFLPLLFS